MRNLYQVCISILLICVAIGAASAQNPPASQGGGSFLLQCPTSTVWHPGIAVLGYDPARQEGSYTGSQTVTETPAGQSSLRMICVMISPTRPANSSGDTRNEN